MRDRFTFEVDRESDSTSNDRAQTIGLKSAMTEGGIAAGLNSAIKQGHRATCVSASDRILI
jgi:hypothetical protein